MSYWKFAAMIATSTVVMFILMYLNTYLVSHVFYSETRAYMAVLMGATMAFVMLAFMWAMYGNRTLNIAILAGAILVFAGSLWLVRSQATVQDRSFMRAMIPHHSIAIMTSTRANLSDPRVQKLAAGIADAQNKEIAEMRYLIDDISAQGDAADRMDDAPADLVSLDEAISTPQIALLDAEPMSPAEIQTVFPDGTACAFSFTTESAPVFVTDGAGDGNVALVKISGDLVALDSDSAGQFSADGIDIRIADPARDEVLTRPEGRVPADMVLHLDAGLTAGYRGYYGCAS